MLPSCVKRFIPSSLVASEGLTRITDLVEKLPTPALGFSGCIECKLGKHASASADYNYSVDSHYGMALPREFLEQPDWKRFHDFCAASGTIGSPPNGELTSSWIVFDLDEPSSNSTVPSLVYFTCAEWDRPRAKVGEALHLLLHRPMATQQTRNLDRCFELLPEGARIAYIGVPFTRRSEALKLVIRIDSLPLIESYLTGLGAGECLRALEPIAALISGLVDRVALQLEAGNRLSPKIGVECYFHDGRGKGNGSKQLQLLDKLVDRGLCTPEQAEAIGSWAGATRYDFVWPSAAEPWGNDLTLAPRYVNRWVNHLKLSYQPDRPLEAKAYMFFREFDELEVTTVRERAGEGNPSVRASFPPSQ